MAIDLARVALDKSKGVIQDLELAVEIEGLTTILGSGSLSAYIRIGDPGLLIGDDWAIGNLGPAQDQLDIITFDGSTTTINQQLNPDKGNVSSISGYQVSLIDSGGFATQLITPGEILNDILGKKANVYVGYKLTAFPQDFTQVFAGIVDEVIGGTNIVLNIAHPEQKKRGEIYTKQSKKLTANANFRSAAIQGINYQTKRDVLGAVSIEYTSGGTAGLEVVTVTGNAISVQIQPSVSTANQIRNAIEKTAAATALVTTQVISGQQALTQSVQAATNLSSSTTLNLDSTSGLLLPADGATLKTYVRINDEIIEYSVLTSTTLTGLTRGAFFDDDERAAGSLHKTGDTVDSFYRLQDNALDLALKILMSGENEFFAANVEIKSFVNVENVGDVANSIYFEGINIVNKYGITVGDFVTIEGDTIPANNVTLAPISSIVTNEFGSYLVLDNSVSLVLNIAPTGTASFKSKYNVLPAGAGLGMGGDEVDVPEFERIKETYSSSIFEYDYYLKDTIVAKDFIDQKLLFPTGAFTIPRLGKISIGYSSPPLAVNGVTVFDADNTTRPDQTKVSRSINKQFYNTIVFKYNDSPLDDKFLNGTVTQDADSKGRIPVGNRVFTIEAGGLRDSVDNTNKIDRIASKLLDRFKFGAERIQVKGFFGPGFNQDVGDVVLYGDPRLNLPDTKTASRDFQPRLFEIANKQMNIQTGEIGYQLLDTIYSVDDARFGIFSPSSLIGSGSTDSSIVITNSYSTKPPALEPDKWTAFVGQKILVRSEDMTFFEETTFISFDSSNNFKMLVSPALSVAPSAGYIVEVATYQDADAALGAIYKSVFVFSDPQVDIVSGGSLNEFDVGAGDIGKFRVGAPIIVHTDDWSSFSNETKILTILGNTITTVDGLGFTPDNTYKVDLIGFEDNLAPYRYV